MNRQKTCGTLPASAALLAGLAVLPGAAHAGTANFAPKTDYPAGSLSRSVTTADFNGDGKLDLAVACQGTNSVRVMMGNGSGAFGAPANYAVGNTPVVVTSTDLNGDGRPELAVANQGSSNVTVLINNGSGLFNSRLDYFTGTTPFSVTSADFNNDGKRDLAVANFNSNTVRVLLGNGSGGFVSSISYVPGSGPFSVTSADLNGDGKLDLAVTILNHATVTVMYGNGSGAFGAPVPIPVGSFPYAVASADFNGDGKADLATANRTSNNVSVLLNNGSGGFSRVDYATGTAPQSLTTGDFDGDGKIDLAIANESANTLSVLANTGSGAFGAKVDYATGSNPYSVTGGDFNADGYLDLVTANFVSNNVSVLLNAPNQAPTVADLPVATDEDAALAFSAGQFDAAFSDADAGNSLQKITVLSLPANGTLTLGAAAVTASTEIARGSIGDLVYTPAANYNGPDSFTFSASDGSADSNVGSVNITVNPVNDAPAAGSQDVEVNEGAALNGTLSGTDADGDTLTHAVAAAPVNGTVVVNTDGSFTYTHNGSETTADSFTFTVSDGTVTSAPATVSITVNPVNDAPVAANDTASTIAVTPVAGNVLLNDSDVDSETLTAALVAGPANGVVELNADGTFTYTPAVGFTGTDSFTYTANDGAAASNTATVAITVTQPSTSLGSKVTGGGVIAGATEGRASFNLNVQSSAKDGSIKGKIDYMDSPAGLSIRSTAITGIVVDGNTARIFGKATINGAGSYDFVVDAIDNGEPGDADSYKIRLSNGFSNGPRTLDGGNIQVHK